MAKLIKKHKTAVFVQGSEEKYVRIHHAPELNRQMNPQTEDYDYIGDEYATTEVTAYKPSEDFSVKTFKGYPDFDLVYAMYKARAIGADAHRRVLTVFIFDELAEGKYYAEEEDATITVSEFNASDSSISFSVAHNGTPSIGYATIEDGVPVFTEGKPDSSAQDEQDP